MAINPDNNGNASTTLTSGYAVLPTPMAGKVFSSAAAILKVGNTIVAGSNKPLDIEAPSMSVDAYNTNTTDPVNDLYLFADGVDLYGNISFNNTPIVSHSIVWKFRFFNHPPAANPLADNDFLFDGTGSSPADPANPGYTLYGSIYNESTPDGYKAYYETGTQPGWMYWYMDDNNVQIEQ